MGVIGGSTPSSPSKKWQFEYLTLLLPATYPHRTPCTFLVPALHPFYLPHTHPTPLVLASYWSCTLLPASYLPRTPCTCLIPTSYPLYLPCTFLPALYLPHTPCTCLVPTWHPSHLLHPSHLSHPLYSFAYWKIIGCILSPLPKSKFGPIRSMQNRSTYHKSAKGSPLLCI